VLTGSVDGAIESEAYKPWYMHRTGHWLGLDVHDVGDYRTGATDDDWVRLTPGMTLTVEPGLYFRPGEPVPAGICMASACASRTMSWSMPTGARSTPARQNHRRNRGGDAP
jgi:hypothetical protein